MFTMEFMGKARPGGRDPEVLHRASYALPNLDAAKEKAKSLLSTISGAKIVRILDHNGRELARVGD